jgi:cytochrome bd-type quinol oxidase subunit 2
MHVPSLHVPRLHVRHRHATSTSARTEEQHQLRVARSVAAFVALATVLLVALWTLSLAGYTEAEWWPAVVILAIAVVGAVGAWLSFWVDR